MGETHNLSLPGSYLPPSSPGTAQTWATLLLQLVKKQGKASSNEETEAALTHFLMSSLISESSATETNTPIFVTN